MSCLVKKRSINSPESTVSSLLAGCSLNSSDSLNFYSSVQYKDKLYRSASQALEAYIEDFTLSCTSSDIKPGKICIPQSTPGTFRSLRDSSKHTHALENVKQHTQLRRRIAYGSDKFSLTTDDLLTCPADGSVSFNTSWPSAQKINRNRKSLITPASYSRYCTSPFGNKGKSDFMENLVFPSSYKEVIGKKPAQYKFHRHDSGLPKKDHLIKPDILFHKNYPRWLTSQKSDLSISEISSIPESKYPIWLKNYNLLLDPGNESSTENSDMESDCLSLKENKELMRIQNVNSSSSSNRLKHNNVICQKHKCDIPRTHFSLQGLREYKDPLIDDAELLIQKARRAVESSTEESISLLKNDGSPCTVDVLEAERLWDNVPVGLKPPVPVACEENSPQNLKASIVNGFLEDCVQNSQQESTFSGGNHHGPVEALKLMLFNLQAVQHSFYQNKTDRQNKESPKILREDEALKLNDCEMIPVAKSLQRALHHLSRLKGLVDITGGKEESKEFKS